MLLYNNNFAEFLEAIAIGPNPEFMKKNTTNCEFADEFPKEVELMYDLKNAKKSSNPLKALRNLSKKIVLYGPELDTATLNFFIKRFDGFPDYYTEPVKAEITEAFDKAQQWTVDIEVVDLIEEDSSPNNDRNFLNSLAKGLQGCSPSCNYFTPMSDSIGTLTDFARGITDNSFFNFAGSGGMNVQPPTNIPTYLYNKISPAFRGVFNSLSVSTSMTMAAGAMPAYSSEQKVKIQAAVNAGTALDKLGLKLPFMSDNSTYNAVTESHSEIAGKIKQTLGDCHRRFDHLMRFNPYDPTMNTSYSKRKYLGVKTSNVKSLIDINGALAPGHYATNNTYKKALDIPTNKDYMKYGDSKVAKKYDNYESPSAGGESVVTGGAAQINPAVAAGVETNTSLDNVPTNGKTLNFNFGEVKLTSYGYQMDECPDTGSELGYGNAGNMIVPLRTVAVNPEAYKQGLVKRGDVLIIQCEDKAGNKWTERRQVGDSSGPGLLNKGGKYKFLIDEYLPDKKIFKSKLAGRSAELKLTITIADTKEPLPKWNVQEASQHAPIFFNRNDFERAKKFSQNSKDWKSHYPKFDTEYIKYVKWNPDSALNQKFINNSGC
jgi:hypothetical protein